MNDANRPSSGQSEEVPRISTGSEGLDDILGGGLDPDRMYLYEGSPGAGKTTLALQFLREGVRQGERVLYVTLSETQAELELIAKRHGWSLDGIDIFELVTPEASLDPELELTVLHPAEIELGETTRQLFDRVNQTNPTRVVFDSLSEMRLLAQSPLRYRRQVLALKHFFVTRHCTVILLDDQTSESGDLQLHSICHGVVMLEQQTIEYGAERRRLRVVKMRGIQFRGGYHDFAIRRGGLQIFPRLVAAEHHASFSNSMVSSGNETLDRMLGGGVERGTNTLLVGTAGVGKSSLALSYAVTACRRGEHTAFFVFDENTSTLRARARALGLPVEPWIDQGLLRLQQIDPAELSPGEFASAVRCSVEESGTRMIVVDSLNGYMYAMPDGKFLILQMHELLSYLGQKGVVSILVLAQQGVINPADTPVDISYLSDALIMQRYFEHEGTIRRALSVVKKRSGKHENSVREFRLSADGIHVGPPLKGLDGILSSAPQYTGDPAKLLPDEHDYA
ncbi:ATPase domain-containing protein [Stutzerimonas frequens]|uniref:ATPase domain-containing protein n=1 Tax=Stutzerimonas frequens TaxID=2968969 RepID=UPI0012E1A977|nr:ATPase domain-containing protein [Stutzerimonas frequens]MUT68919.1 AAA family ATPase [Stutzerimonas frequens]MUT70348.1 AAA family ATPase [Stutzerimonas frequens]